MRQLNVELIDEDKVFFSLFRCVRFAIISIAIHGLQGICRSFIEHFQCEDLLLRSGQSLTLDYLTVWIDSQILLDL